jgi:P4 family phage/plasmid primase-like protien
MRQQHTVSVSEIDAVAQQIAPLLEDGQVVELRVLGVDGRQTRTDSGYFDNLDDLARYAAVYSGRAPGIYITLNPVNPALLARAANRVKEYARTTTSDTDILTRRWFPIDCDPRRPADISSNDIEHEAALSRAKVIADWLSGRGWPDPIFADSGNGAHLLYRTELPNDAETAELFSCALQAIAMTVDDDAVSVDTSVFNAARIWKVYGTQVCKGDDLPERPHRTAQILSLPDKIQTVDVQLLRDLAALMPAADEDRTARRGRADFDLEAWIAEHGLRVRGPMPWGKGGQRWLFDVCPWNPAHTNKSAFIVRFANGAIAAGCHHNSCQGRSWRDLREMYDGPAPERRERAAVQRTAALPPQINREDFDPLAYRAEDGGILDAWYALYSHQWVFAPGWDIWLFWQGTHWQRDETLRIEAQVEVLLDEMNRAAADAASKAQADLNAMGKDDEGRDELDAEVKRLRTLVSATKRSKSRIESVSSMARNRVAVHSREFNITNTLNLANGTLHLDTFELHPHRQEDRLTYILPYNYDPEATCPRWEQFLREVLVREVGDNFVPDEELIKLYQELWGYSLTTDTKHGVIVFQVGEGGNGKSVAIKVLNALLGEQLSVTLDFAKLGSQGNYDISRIPGKRVLLSTESRKGSRIPEDLLKAIADGEPLSARAPYETPFEFRPVGKTWWSMNHLPRINDTTMSIWRRMKIIPFRRQFSVKDKTADVNLSAKLLKELPGILNWALLGLERLNTTGRFTTSTAVEEQVDSYRTSSNPIKLWLEERCEPTKDRRPVTKPSTLYDDYLRWCDNNGYERDVIVNSREFSQELRRLGYASARSAAGMRYPLLLRLPDDLDDAG